MNIVRIIADKLPESASRCFAATSHHRNDYGEFEAVKCRFMQRWAYMSCDDFVTQRCPDCPLELECEK